MKRILLCTIIGIIATSFCFSQNPSFGWAAQVGGTSFDWGYSITTDDLGNIYTVGSFGNTVDFNPGSESTILTSNGLSDIFIQKLDPNRNLIWVKQIGGTGLDRSNSVITDVDGNVYLIGSFRETVDFDPSAGIMSLTSNGIDDIFVLKLDSNGNLIWVKQMGGVSTEVGLEIVVDDNGNIYATGYFMGTTDFDPGAGNVVLTSNGNEDIYIQKLDSNGSLIWVKQIGGTSIDLGRSMAVDNNSDIYITGTFAGTVDFDPGTGTFSLTSNGVEDIFVQKLDPDGNLIWVKQMGSAFLDWSNSISIDVNGDVYTTGRFSSTVDFDPGSGVTNLTSNGNTDIYIQKLDSDGNFCWVKQMGGTSEDAAKAISVDVNGFIYSTGRFSSTVDFDPGSGALELTSNGNTDVYIQKLDPDGNLIWVGQIGGTDDDEGLSLTIDIIGNIYTTGIFEETVDLDPGTGNQVFTSNGAFDIFILKLNQDILGLNENAFPSRVVISPNPNQGIVNINYGELAGIRLIIRELNGRIIYFEKPETNGVHQLEIPFSPGIYFLEVNSNNQKQIIKIIKE